MKKMIIAVITISLLCCISCMNNQEEKKDTLSEGHFLTVENSIDNKIHWDKPVEENLRGDIFGDDFDYSPLDWALSECSYVFIAVPQSKDVEELSDIILRRFQEEGLYLTCLTFDKQDELRLNGGSVNYLTYSDIWEVHYHTPIEEGEGLASSYEWLCIDISRTTGEILRIWDYSYPPTI